MSAAHLDAGSPEIAPPRAHAMLLQATTIGQLRPCVDFQCAVVGPDVNPLVFSTSLGDVSFEAVGAAGTEYLSDTFERIAYVGLQCSPELTVSIPSVETVVLLVLTANGVTRVSAANAEGNPVGAEVDLDFNSLRYVRLSGWETGQSITTVQISVDDTLDGQQTLLLQCCLEPSGIMCLDFRDIPESQGANPRPEQGFWFVMYDSTGGPAVASRIVTTADPGSSNVFGSGLHADRGADILLPECADAVEAVFVRLGSPTPITVEAKDEANVVIDTGSPGTTRDQEHVVTLTGDNIRQVRVQAPGDESVMRGLCYEPC